MKQTAVEWLAEKIGHNSLMALTEYNEILEQAKAMEKEQIIDIIKLVIEKEYHEQSWAKCGSMSYIAEQYYKQTYESKTNL